MPFIEASDSDPPTHDLGTVETYNTENEGTRLADYPHQKSVTAGYWDPRGTRIVSTCYDDRLRCRWIRCSSRRPLSNSSHFQCGMYPLNCHSWRHERHFRVSSLSVRLCMTAKRYVTCLRLKPTIHSLPLGSLGKHAQGTMVP